MLYECIEYKFYNCMKKGNTLFNILSYLNFFHLPTVNRHKKTKVRIEIKDTNTSS